MAYGGYSGGYGRGREGAISGGRAAPSRSSPGGGGGGGRERAVSRSAPSRPAGGGGGDAARQQAIREVQQRGEAQPKSLAASILGAIGEYTRQQIIKGIQEGGTPVRDPRQNNMVIGVRSASGAYTGRETLDQILERGRGEGGGQAAQTAMAAQDTMGAPEEPPPPARRVRTELGQRLEEENRRRRLAGLRRLGTRTLLGSDRFGTDTLGA